MSKFQQRHYEAIAEVFQAQRNLYENLNIDPNKEAALTEFENRLADLFRHDNNLFDEQRFHRACIPGANVKARTR